MKSTRIYVCALLAVPTLGFSVGGCGEDTGDQVDRALEEQRTQVEQIESDIDDTAGEVTDGASEGADDLGTEAEQARDEIESDVQELEDRLDGSE